jgi:hypothetical protein
VERLKIPQPYSAAGIFSPHFAFFSTSPSPLLQKCALSYIPDVLGDGLFLKDDVSKEIPLSIAVV